MGCGGQGTPTTTPTHPHIIPALFRTIPTSIPTPSPSLPPSPHHPHLHQHPHPIPALVHVITSIHMVISTHHTCISRTSPSTPHISSQSLTFHPSHISPHISSKPCNPTYLHPSPSHFIPHPSLLAPHPSPRIPHPLIGRTQPHFLVNTVLTNLQNENQFQFRIPFPGPNPSSASSLQVLPVLGIVSGVVLMSV